MKRSAEGAVRKLGLYATYAGYFPLVDLVGALAEGRECGQELLLEVARRYEISVKTLNSRIRTLMQCARRNAPEQWQEWFGRERVSVKLFSKTIAAHVTIR